MSNCDDIKPRWLDVARRLQEFCSHTKGRSKFVTIEVAVDSDNVPIFWYKPTMKPVEPKLTREQLVRLFASMQDDESVEI